MCIRDRLNTVMHEFGHALGLGHNERKDVMSKFSNVTELTENDKKSYDAAYRLSLIHICDVSC